MEVVSFIPGQQPPCTHWTGLEFWRREKSLGPKGNGAPGRPPLIYLPLVTPYLCLEHHGASEVPFCSSGRTMALELTQPLTEMSTRDIFWRTKAAGA